MQFSPSQARTATTAVARSAVRWAAVFAGAAAGAYAGRVVAARLYQEPAPALAEIAPRRLLEQDVAPGFLAAELIGRSLGMGVAGEAVVAAVAAGLAVVATGPLAPPTEPDEQEPRIIPVAGGRR